MKTAAERQREYRARKKARAVAEGVTDESPIPAQAVAVARKALAVARAKLGQAATIEDAGRATRAAAEAVKVEKDCGGLVERAAVEAWYAGVVRGVEDVLAVMADPAFAVALTADAAGGPDNLAARLRGELDRLAAAVPGELRL